MVQDVKPGGVFMINCQWNDEELGHHLNAEAKKYIADNNIRLYTINAIDKAIEIGMGKRTNTILQSAFFKLADVMPIEDAVNFMKQAAQKSYGKKGQDVVEMNWKAIDAGVDAIHKVDVPASWSNPEADPAPKELSGRPELVKQIRNVMEPIARMDGDSLPVSAFVANANGEWEQGASAYEKRGTAVNVPEWDAAKCVGCNQCAFVCSHATIRPFQLTADELAAAPAQTKSRDNKPANEYKFVMAVSPLDCMGCGECVTVCPTKAIQMVPQESQADQQAVFDYCVANISKKPSKFADDTVIGSQFNQPINTLKVIAAALEIPMYKFFMGGGADKNLVVRRDARITLGRPEAEDIVYELLTANVSGSIEFCMMHIPAKNGSHNVESIHKGEEVAYVAQGKITVYINGAAYELETGDSVLIPPGSVHRWQNSADEEAQVLFAVTPPSF